MITLKSKNYDEQQLVFLHQLIDDCLVSMESICCDECIECNYKVLCGDLTRLYQHLNSKLNGLQKNN